ncbi:hypothetical protein [Lentilactobacillus sp. SPB1-3]|uniref:Uncharacterized protein n=1 Tax=Lentilactobacillus terminaliae TaxID=3003483 RepID=A0ACD5DCJ9_9LACO|nr:hypothetical protein [Lentilactobacillus sp. SPB1-3]MCZ0977131.1 hypothetical protein [Lentilactobacillus sp. SPB1-3]
MKNGFNVMLVFLIGLLVLITIFQWVMSDKSMETYTQNYINTALTDKKYSRLKNIVRDKEVYNKLKTQKKITLKFTADNQGAGRIAYFPAKVSGFKGNIGVDINMKSILLHQYKLIRITNLGNMTS